MAIATSELIWTKQLLKELKFWETARIELIYDNRATPYIAFKIHYSMRIHKHIDIDYHFVREKILSASGYIVMSFIKSNDLFANIITKLS